MKRQPLSNKRPFLLNFIAALIHFAQHDSGDTAHQPARWSIENKNKILSFFFSPPPLRSSYWKNASGGGCAVLAGWVYLYINNTKCKWQSSSATGSQHYYNYLGRVRSGSDRPVRQTQNTATLTLNKFSNIALSTNLCIFCNG